MGKKKIVIDTNNFISALGWGGNSKELVLKVIDGCFELFVSEKQLAEIKRVLDYPRFKFTEEQKANFLGILSDIAKIIETNEKITEITEDPEDNLLLECAAEAGADFIISGDNHLRKLKEFRNIKIISAKEAVELAEKN